MIKIFQAFKGPARYIFKDPDSGHLYSADNKQRLADQIIAYREQNRLPPLEALNEIIDNYLCTLPENDGKCEGKILKRGWRQWIRGGIALVTNMIFQKFVSQEESDRRASICLTCPENFFPDRDGFIKWADNLAEDTNDGRKSVFHNDLGNCAVCSCSLRSKVWYGGEIKLSEKEVEKMKALPIKCWQLEKHNAGRSNI